MKKRLLKNAMLRKRIWLRKMFLRMNYLFCLLVLGALSVSAEVYSQNGLVSLKMKDVSLVKVFNEITKQTLNFFPLTNHAKSLSNPPFLH